MLLLVCSTAIAWGQANNGASNNTGQPKGIEFHVDEPDSVLQASVFMFQLHPLQVRFYEYGHPDFDPTHAQFHNRLDAFNGNYYLSVTELGHPHIALFRDYTVGLGLSYRPQVFLGFYKTPGNITLYQTKKPYTLLGYHSSLKKDYQLHVTHTQNITERWNFALDYHLFSPQGTFANSAATDHLLDFSTNYYSRDARYQLAAGIIMQRMNLGENGGLATDSIYTQQMIDEEGGIPVNETMRHSITRDLTLYAHQSFNTVRQYKWHRPRKQPVADSAGRLHDSITGYDTIQGKKPHVLNTGVFAFDLQYDRQQYRYTDSTRYHRLSSRIYWTNDAFYGESNPCKLSLGIRPETDRLELRDSLGTALTDVEYYPFAQALFAFGKKRNAHLRVLGEMGLGCGEYTLDIAPSFAFGNEEHPRTLLFQVNTGAASPDLIYSLQAADADAIRNVETLRLHGEFRGRWIDMSVSANHISHNIWLDNQLRTVQSDSSALLLQGRLTARLQLGRVHLDLQQMVQHSSDQDQIRVPLLASKNSAYVDFKLFHGAMSTQVGADLRYHSPFKADGYAPSLGAFYRQDETVVGGYLYGDLFVNLQIKRASIYVKAGHLNSLFEQQSYCILPHYPMRGFGIYYGLTWQFFD